MHPLMAIALAFDHAADLQCEGAAARLGAAARRARRDQKARAAGGFEPSVPRLAAVPGPAGPLTAVSPPAAVTR